MNMMKTFFNLILFCAVSTTYSQVIPLTEIGQINDILSEPSGINVHYNTANGNLEYWAHNDYGNPDSIFSFRLSDLHTMTRILHVDHDYIDWEDMAHDPNGNIYLADFGNFVGPNEYNVIKIPNPNTYTGDPPTLDTIKFEFPFNGIKDNEAIFHFNDSLYIFTKRIDTIQNPTLVEGFTYCFRIPDEPRNDGGSHVAQYVGGINTYVPGDTSTGTYRVTGADISPDGKKMVLITYERIWVFSCFADSDFFGGTISNLRVPFRQYEGVAFVNNHEIVLTKEGKLSNPGYNPKIYYIDLFPWIDGSCISCEKVRNGGFYQSNMAWSAFTYPPADATFDMTDGLAEIDVHTIGTSLWHINLRHKSLILQQGKTYRISYHAWAEDDRDISIIMTNAGGGLGYAYNRHEITTAPTHYSYEFTMNEATDYDATLSFNVGRFFTHKVYFDDLSLVALDCVCPSRRYFISPIQNQIVHHEVDSTLYGSNVIHGDIVEYDAGFDIILNEGFEVKLGAEFIAYIDGCD